MKNLTANGTLRIFPDKVWEETGRPCFLSGVPQAFQRNYFHYPNFVLVPVTVLLALWCLLSNGSVLVIFLRGGLSLRAGLCSLCSLTLSDVLWAGLVVPLYTSFRITELMSGKTCANRADWDNPVMVSSFFLCVFSTVGTLGVMSVDRHLAISKAEWYRTAVSKHHTIFACYGVWLVSLAMVVLRQVAIFPHKALESFEACYLVLFSSLIITLQLLTLVKLRCHNNAVANIIEDSARANNPAIATERKLAVITRHVVGLLGLLIIPVSLSVVLSHITGIEFSPFAEPLYFPLATLCSGVNPVLYYKGNSQIRQEITKLVKCQ